MNNKFNFKRFCQVVANDGRLYLRKFGIGLLVWISLPILLWISALVFEIDMDFPIRFAFIQTFIAGTVMTVPAIVYGKVNLAREGVGFAMLPATSTEKFLSMVFYCSIVTPLLCFIGCLIVDSFLTLLPFGGFKEFINLFGKEIFEDDYVFPVYFYIWTAMAFIAESSAFMLGNMIFRKRKTGKTFAWISLILFVLILVIQIPPLFDGLDYLMNLTTEHLSYWISVILLLVIATSFNLLTYRKIKNQKY